MKLNFATFILLFTVFCFICEQPSASAAAPTPTQNERLLQQIQKLNDPPQRYLKLPELPFIEQAPSTTPSVQTTDLEQQPTASQLAQEQPTRQEQSQTKQKKQKIQPKKSFTRQAPKRRDPHSIVAAARQKHSPLQGRSISFKEPAIVLQIKQWAGQIASTKQRIASDIKQQPEQIRAVLMIATADLQKQSTRKLKTHADNVHSLFQDKIKAPLRNLFKKIEAAAHETVVRLQ
ncbi:MAG: hypothetical protein AAFP20_09975 [Cyanobacteria bacterium J06614_10]